MEKATNVDESSEASRRDDVCRDGRRVASPVAVWATGRHSIEHRRGTMSRLNEFDLIFDQIKLQISYSNLKFGQNKSCRGKEDLQLSFWAKADLGLGLRRKTRSNVAKSKVTMRT